MALKPLKDRVVAKIEKPAEKTAAGILLGDTKEKTAYAVVESVGPEVKSVKKGDKIVYKEYSTMEVKIEKEEFIILKEEDILATFLSVKRSSYLLLGNPPRLYNDFDGLLALFNGVVVVNRKNQKSRHSSIDKCKRVLELGSDLILFPEGVDNKTPNALVLHLFSGIYQIAKDRNVKIVPVIHYKEEDKNILHTVIDDPIDVSSMSREEALMTLRDRYSYWKYLMMEKYGQSTREKEVGNILDVDSYWEEKIKSQYKQRYDREAEVKAFYATKSEREYYQALDDIAHLEENPNTVLLVEDAKKLVKSQIQRRV